MAAPQDPKLDVGPDGLKAAERELLDELRITSNPALSLEDNGDVIIGALETLGRLRVRGLTEFADAPPTTDELAERVRLALDRLTVELLTDSGFDLGDHHRLKDLVVSFAALGGPEFDRQAAGTQARALEAERAVKALEDLIDDVLDAVSASTTTGAQAASILVDSPVFEPLRDAIRRLAQARGR